MSACIMIDRKVCIGCGKCVVDCPNFALVLDGGKAAFVKDGCLECGHCVAICPTAAVSMSGYDMGEVADCASPTPGFSAGAFLGHIRSRRSVRHFQPQPVQRQKIERIIEAGRYTLTGKNRKATRYVVVENSDDNIERDAAQMFLQLECFAGVASSFSKDAAALKGNQVGDDSFFHHAPVAILVVSEDTVDAALASANMETMAEALGLGVLYEGFFVRAAKESKMLRDKLGIEADEKLVIALALGYSAVEYERTAPRKKAVVQWADFGGDKVE